MSARADCFNEQTETELIPACRDVYVRAGRDLDLFVVIEEIEVKIGR